MQKMMMHICFTAFHETDCKSNKFQSGKALTVSHTVQFFLFNCNSRPIMSHLP